ncbi:hypothetical protein PHLGIDRAFT_25232 [Phlebiopsis gigantea 11061_1 CR5-6]|uniref:Ribosomal RNA small subunit methyltransferase NEP1 n=1 Tax=Phlebiopsis gigantea (strain 11061_1 CR5-6) TaxID=745531 RepID=A0A0C3PH25_PHLG1|nr:hypothetical protein PHLGIDRAFT_25232 [Phlebiopsis gigantea 11061_1 CR5-6]
MQSPQLLCGSVARVETPRRTLYIVLERASMEICRPAASARGRTRESKPTLLTCDDHQGLLVRMGRDASDARPDITHQCLLTLLDSPLNKCGLLRVFVHTTQGISIEVHPDVRIPRTYKRYSGLMVQLLQEGEIRGTSDAQVLMRVLEHPIANYLPTDATKIALSADAHLEHPRALASRALSRPLVFFVGAMAKGPDNFATGVAEHQVSLSEFPLSASAVLAKLCCAVEDLYGIL